eukprot:jgi/Botrbrau1/5717/Bobra.0071s0048.1
MTREAIWCLTLLGVFQVLAGAKLPPCLQKSKGSFEEPGSDAAPDLLFTQQAHEAILEVLIADEIYADLGATLTLVGVAPTTTWFTDRPNRKAGHVATGLLTSSPVFFKETEFGSDELAWLGAPNALLTGVVVEGDGDGSPAPAICSDDTVRSRLRSPEPHLEVQGHPHPQRRSQRRQAGGGRALHLCPGGAGQRPQACPAPQIHWGFAECNVAFSGPVHRRLPGGAAGNLHISKIHGGELHMSGHAL